MYNYYLHTLRKANELKQAEEQLNKEKDRDKRKRKMNALVSKYEKRINNFVLQMAEKPIQIKRTKDQFISSRQDYLDENSNKILFKKGFVFTNFKTEKERIKDYLQEQSSLLKYYTNTEVPNYNEKYTPQYKIIQPSMRFKPRTDLERVYDALKEQNIIDKDNRLVKNQLNRMGFKTQVIQPSDNVSVVSVHSEASDNQIPIEKAKSKKELHSKTTDDRSEMLNLKQSNLSQPKYTLKNKEARYLRSDLHNKTHFKAVEALSMFKTSTMNQDAFKTFYKKDDEEQRRLNENRRNYRTITDGFTHAKKKYHDLGVFHTLPNLAKEPDVNLGAKFFGNKKILQDPDIAKEIANSNPLLFNMNFNSMKTEASNQPVSNEQLALLRQLAFDNESQQKKEASDLKEQMKPEQYDDYKKEDNVKIDGEVFKKQEMDKIADKVLRKCNWNSNKVKYNKIGQGKLMFTNGLTLTEFSTKYGFFA